MAEVTLWAHNSLGPQGFVVFMGITYLLVAVPLISVLGSPVLWAILPFFALVLSLMWWALKRSWADRAVTETLRIWPDRLVLEHRPRRGPVQTWTGNPHWVVVHLHAARGRVRNYITLTGGDDRREVELGRFLTPEERAALHRELQALIGQAAAL